MEIKVKKTHPDAIVPSYQTPGASGFDLHSLEEMSFLPGQTKLVKTGIAFEIPKGTEIQIRPRSGISLKTGLRVTNSPGTLDSDYRGECCVIIQNTSQFITKIEKDERIAQAVLCPVLKANFVLTEELNDTERGVSGFGSSGK